MIDARRTAAAAALALTTAGLLAACSGNADATSDGGGSGSGGASASSDATGTWTETGDYQSPGGAESVTVKLTAKDGTVTAVEVTGSGNTPNAKRYQAAFISGVSAEVVGKPLADLEVGAVSGSSLTGQGFNAAVEKIRTDAASS